MREREVLEHTRWQTLVGRKLGVNETLTVHAAEVVPV